MDNSVLNEIRAIDTADKFHPPEVSQDHKLELEAKRGKDMETKIPLTSPVYVLQSLETGWDGYRAEPLSQDVLLRADQFWSQIENSSSLPIVQASANGSVAFTWSHEYPDKELEIWLYDRPEYYAEWMLSIKDKDKEDIARSVVDLLMVVKQYQES
jgi:hypothetical protein